MKTLGKVENKYNHFKIVEETYLGTSLRAPRLWRLKYDEKEVYVYLRLDRPFAQDDEISFADYCYLKLGGAFEES